MKTKKITNYLKGFFSQNLGLKLFAFVFAFGMWFMVMNTLNPAEIKTFNVKLTVNGASALSENDLVCTNLDEIKEQTVAIKIQATRPDLAALSSNKEKITAAIDLSKFASLAEDELSLPIYAAIVPNISVYSNAYEIAGYTPSGISLNIDKLTEFDVPVKIIEYNTSSSKMAECKTSVKSISVKGPLSMQENVAYAGLNVDVSSLTDDSVISVAPVLYGSDDKPLEDSFFTVLSGKIDVTSEIYKYGKVSIEPPNVLGHTADGFKFSDEVKIDPDEITVLGKSDNLKINSIKLPPIVLNGESSDYTENVSIKDILAQSGLTAANPEQESITVTVAIEKEEATELTLNAENITIKGLADDLELAVPLSDITFKAVGIPEEELGSITPAGAIDLSGLTQGENTVRLNLTNVASEEDVFVTVQLKSKEELTTNPSLSEDSSKENIE